MPGAYDDLLFDTSNALMNSYGLLDHTDAINPVQANSFNLGEFTNAALSVFDNGLKIFSSVADRVTALGKINQESVKDALSKILPPVKVNVGVGDMNWKNIGIIVLVILLTVWIGTKIVKS
jgi:hypothetical protein